MIAMEGWTTIRYLHAQGKGARTIAKELGLARNTVRAAIRAEQPPRRSRAKRPNPALAAYAEQIRHMALTQRLIGSRILRELQTLGYRGGSTALYDYLRTLKVALPDARVTERYETPPAQQGQFDWSPYTVDLAGAPTHIVAFGLTLGYSRRKHYWLSRDETQVSVFEAIEAGFRHFGGVPKELLVDNAKVFVVHAQPERFSWNARFLEFCGHYAVQPVACRPYWPRTKGKVERPFYYLEEQFLKGRAWPSFADLDTALTRFIAEDLDVRVHHTTQERPLARFQREHGLLTPLPSQPFLGTHEETRLVSWDCLVSFDGSRYSVPWAYAGQRVWVRPSQGVRLSVRSQAGTVIAAHVLSAVTGATVIDPAHYEGLRAEVPKTRALVTAAFLERFPEQAWFLTELLAAHPPNGVAHLQAILRLADIYPAPAVAAACEAARPHHAYNQAFIRGVLEAGTAPAQRAPTLLVPARAPAGVVTADLSVYQALLGGTEVSG
jgi:transposase